MISPCTSTVYYIITLYCVHFVSDSVFENDTLNMTSLFIFNKVNKFSFVKNICRFPLFGHFSIPFCSSQQRSHNHSWVIKWAILIYDSCCEFITNVREELLQLWPVHKCGEVKLDSILRSIMMINQVVYDWSCIVVHGFENVSSWDNKGYLLC